MARPKSEKQTARHEEDALREKAVTESRQKAMDQPHNRGAKEAMDRNPVPKADDARAKKAREAVKVDPNLGPNQMLDPKLAGEVGPGSPVSRADRTQQFKIDEDRSVNASDKEAAIHRARHHKNEPDQKPTAESNLSDHNRNALPDPVDEIPADKRMHISDDLAGELANKFAHHEIRYTESGIDVLSGGEMISIDKKQLGKLGRREDLRAYIDSLPVVRHG